MHTQLPTRSITYANGDSGPRVFHSLCQWGLWPKGLRQPMPMGTLAQGSSTAYANGDSGPRVFDYQCQWGLSPKGLPQPMPMGTQAQGFSTAYANGDSGPRVFNNPMGLRPKGVQQPNALCSKLYILSNPMLMLKYYTLNFMIVPLTHAFFIKHKQSYISFLRQFP